MENKIGAGVTKKSEEDGSKNFGNGLQEAVKDSIGRSDVQKKRESGRKS